ncbi:hypothetical protein SAY87_010561 [Trapa incisa]|uniref:Alpha-1,3-glucosyltransferase n=1 Tax=Trapa incisa TaxID=236973 RepID=A0AAN7JHQ0_9MYRT|nr:hypothetical protein SAY87_010561 [Trapa incisa]
MRELWWYIGVVTCLKLLLIPAYHSTDFEVHRNWLALTRSLPLCQWYSDETSPWTLDYPPFFAFFERFLSLFASLVDPKIVHLHEGLNCKSPTAIYFQRLTVIASDSCLFYAIHRLARNFGPIRRNLLWILVAWSPMLVIVDHIHFQYNGFLLGLLLLSISFLMDGRDLAGGFIFAVLLCFKHLFAVAAPVYFVYLLRHYCWGRGLLKGFFRLSVMGITVISVFAAAYGPFAYHGQIQQVLLRMFPFGRGLSHSYWAPNIWVFYIILDKMLVFMLRKLGFSFNPPISSFTGGLVGDVSSFSVLPKITPLTTFIIVLIALSPSLINVWSKPQPKSFSRWVAFAYTCGFLFGWHVHEKASLHFVIPLTVLAVQNLEDAMHYFLLSIVSCYSLFPLLFERQEYPIRVLLLLLHSLLMWLGFSYLYRKTELCEATVAANKLGGPHKASSSGEFKICSMTRIYLFGLVIIELYGQFLHPYLLGNDLPFLPLMMISTYCALGMTYSWIWQLRQIIRL